jgi:L-fuconolactonase
MTPSFDAHTHIWERPWQQFVVGTGRKGTYAQRDLMLWLLDKFGVERACVLAACDDEHPDNNRFVARLCRATPDRFVMFSEVPLQSGSRNVLLARTLEDWPAVGFRYQVPKHENPTDWSAPGLEAFWAKADSAELAVALNLSPAQAGQLPPLIKRYPHIRWLLDHMGRPSYSMSDAEYRPVLELAAYPNVFVKISGFYAFTAPAVGYPYADLARFVAQLRTAYGPNRMLWGSDAPPVLDFGSYEQSFQCLMQSHMGLTASDLNCLFGGTAHALFRRRPGKSGA